MTDPQLTLTPAQLAFMLWHHDSIEQALDNERRGNSQRSREVLNGLLHADEYQRLFGNMVWDEALDRYEDMPEYDGSLRRSLIEQLEKDMRAGFVPTVENGTDNPARMAEQQRRQQRHWRGGWTICIYHAALRCSCCEVWPPAPTIVSLAR